MSVKIGSGQISGLQQSLLDLQKLKIGEVKKAIFEIKFDKKEISKDALNLKNIDAEKSDIAYHNHVIDFNLIFNILPQAQLKISGLIKTEEQYLEASFIYLFQKDVVVQGKIIPKNFVLNLKMKASFEEALSSEKVNNKEDILQFIQKLVTNIFDSFNDPANSLQSIFVNQNNLKAITKTDHEDLAGMINSLLGAVFSFLKFSEMNNRDNIAAGMTIVSDSRKHDAKEYVIKKIQSFSIEINQLDPAKNNQ